MMDKMILGRYIPGNSWLHRIDPRAKITAVMAFIAIVFLANNWLTYALMFVYVLYLVLTSKVPFLFFIKGLQPIFWLILITLLLQVFFTKGGTVLVDLGLLQITTLGLANGAMMFCRFVLIIFMTTLLTLTTSPIELTDGLEKILAPFRLVHLSVHELALMLSISLRFIPTLMDETEKILKAQKLVGLNLRVENGVIGLKRLFRCSCLFLLVRLSVRKTWRLRWKLAVIEVVKGEQDSVYYAGDLQIHFC